MPNASEHWCEMKQIIVYIKPDKLPSVSLALQEIQELPGVSFSEVRGFGSARTPEIDLAIGPGLADSPPTVRLEIFCPDWLVYEVECTVGHAAYSEQNGNGKIYVLDVDQAIRIHTVAHGEAAL